MQKGEGGGPPAAQPAGGRLHGGETVCGWCGVCVCVCGWVGVGVGGGVGGHERKGTWGGWLRCISTACSAMDCCIAAAWQAPPAELACRVATAQLWQLQCCRHHAACEGVCCIAAAHQVGVGVVGGGEEVEVESEGREKRSHPALRHGRQCP
jgi:hypothetical protein